MGLAPTFHPVNLVPGEAFVVTLNTNEGAAYFRRSDHLRVVRDVLERLCRCGPYQLVGLQSEDDRLCVAFVARNGNGQLHDLVYRLKHESGILFMQEFGMRLWQGGFHDRSLGVPEDAATIDRELSRSLAGVLVRNEVDDTLLARPPG